MAAKRMAQSGLTDPRQAKVASEIVKTTDRATRILDDLLDLTRSSFGTDLPLAKSETSMLALCEEIADEFRGIDATRSIELQAEGDPVGHWDCARMGQVISNVIGNAIQYSDASTPVTVTVSGHDPQVVRVSVHNFGARIPIEKQKTILAWNRGQVSDPSRHTHIGLGLYVTKLVVEAHGGDIALVSDEQRGTTFTLQLPRA
jgi:signal transduction histidine kinase